MVDYSFSLKLIIKIPNELKEANNFSLDIDCFSVQYEKNDSSITAGKLNKI
jgi:hypothetical protein